MVIVENVKGAPWDIMVKHMREAGYKADHMNLDTKDYFIPQTRTRGYCIYLK